MRGTSRVVGTAFGLLVISGCSSIDPGGEAGAGGVGAGGDTMASAGSEAGSAGTFGGAGGSGGSNAGGGGSGGLGGSNSGAGGGFAGANAAGASAAGSGGLGGAGGTPSHRFSIRFDYRFDTVGFFTPERRTALEAAGATWSNLIHDDFVTVPKGTGIRLRNPENRDEYVWVNSIEEDIDDLLVFVGTSEAIPGLGRGGPSGTTQTDDTTLAAALAARQNGADFEPWAGSITFKASSNFFFDQTPETANDIAPEGFDFTSVATHELGHVLGFATCPAFTNLTSGTSFIGPAAQANYGGPVPLMADAGHFQDHLQSDGGDTLMDPGTSNGIRVVPTHLDRAVFIDLGFRISN
jgi:hypothetical protein